MLLIFEDTHWTDPTSLQMFGRAADRVMMRIVVLILTFPPEFDAPWIGRPHVPALTINRLAQREVGAPANIHRTLSSAQTAFRCSWRR